MTERDAEYWDEVYQERAAIYDFEAGMSREAAEARAFDEVRKLCAEDKRRAEPELFGEVA
ncbi:MAG: hypothetical protein DHS20C21_03150 [Gemmatimonadota bacterium]|nr:MAG: hypothetical protein DHS20C21_03150 [Gemmatimonadota bacterium]